MLVAFTTILAVLSWVAAALFWRNDLSAAAELFSTLTLFLLVLNGGLLWLPAPGRDPLVRLRFGDEVKAFERPIAFGYRGNTVFALYRDSFGVDKAVPLLRTHTSPLPVTSLLNEMLDRGDLDDGTPVDLLIAAQVTGTLL